MTFARDIMKMFGTVFRVISLQTNVCASGITASPTSQQRTFSRGFNARETLTKC
jgi:hypothetical protein